MHKFYTEYDYNALTGVSALLQRSFKPGTAEIVVCRDNRSDPIAAVPGHFLPGALQLSPDGSRITFHGNGRIYVYEIDRDQTRAVFDDDGQHACFPSWSPDGEKLAFGAYPVTRSSPPRIYTLDLASSEIRQVSDSPGVDRFPHWNPAGERIAARRHKNIVVCNSVSEESRVLVGKGGRLEINRYSWHPNELEVLATVEIQDDLTSLRIFHVATGEEIHFCQIGGLKAACFTPTGTSLLIVTKRSLLELSYPGMEEQRRFAFSAASDPVFTLMGPQLAVEAAVAGIRFLGVDSNVYHWDAETDCQSVLKAPSPPAPAIAYESEEYWFAARDGHRIPVIRCLPSRGNGRCIVFVDGGPGAKLNPRNPTVLELLQAGYEVLRPVYRGQDGYGSEHLRANQEVAGEKDVTDLIDCALDWQERFARRGERLALAGFSYGGFLTFLALTHADAPWCCGISLWGCTQHVGPLPDDPLAREQALAERSPIRQAGRIAFPVLILHGSRDTTASVTDVTAIRQSVEERGLHCKLVVFEGGTHGLQLSRKAMYEEVFAFLVKHR